MTICLGIILPRLLIMSFGSEVNGLLSAVTQIYTYIAILEAGIGTASLNELYKRFSCNDTEGISNVLSATKKYFRRVSIIYACCVLIVTMVMPFILDTEIDKVTIAALIFLQGCSGLVNFVFTSSIQQLLFADGKLYVTSIIDFIVTIVSYLARIILVYAGYDVIAVQSVFFAVSLLKAIIIYAYYRKNYSWITYNKKANISLLKQRGAFMVHEISGVINSSTDVILLSVFCSLSEASVYAVYNLIYNNLHSLIIKISSSIDFYLGQTYHRSKEEYIKLHDVTECYYITLTFSVFTAAYLMTLSFIRLYTNGVQDANYIDGLLPLLFIFIELLSCTRLISSKLINIAGHAKNTRINTIIEASINLVSSLILVNIWGLRGVLLGTILASLYRTNDIVLYVNKKILNRNPLKTYKVFFVNIAVFIFIFLVEKFVIQITAKSYFEFALKGLIVLALSLTVYLASVSVVCPGIAKTFILIIKQKLAKRGSN